MLQTKMNDYVDLEENLKTLLSMAKWCHKAIEGNPKHLNDNNSPFTDVLVTVYEKIFETVGVPLNGGVLVKYSDGKKGTFKVNQIVTVINLYCHEELRRQDAVELLKYWDNESVWYEFFSPEQVNYWFPQVEEIE